MNVVDSSGWLEYFANGKNAEFFGEPLEDFSNLIVPSITIYEAYKRTVQLKGRKWGRFVAAIMVRPTVVQLDAMLPVEAAHVSRTMRLAMADSIILATARAFDATLWTQGADFEGVTGVSYRPRQT